MPGRGWLRPLGTSAKPVVEFAGLRMVGVGSQGAAQLDEGGGFLVEYPDLPGCISDGETIEEAIANAEDAKGCWIAAMKEAGRPIPAPSGEPAEGYSGKWQLRAPKSLHRRLA